jgi:restriction system protein
MDDNGLDEIREDTVARTHELIKDKLLRLTADDMEQLAAAILRAMGYKTRVMPKGPDRGVDVHASPDGLGLEEPRVKVQVKHRSGTSIGSEDIRCFLGGLRAGDKALYISSGGFTREAKYEADRSIIPLTLLGLDELASLIVSHYESFDIEGRVLMPLVKVFFPAE